jgi:ABC-type glycerol-3-phosphate transport system substrate-binding protein
MTSMRYVTSAIIAVVLSLLSAACGGVSDPSKNTSEDFKGTIGPGEARLYEFDAKKNGEYTATIPAMAPDLTTILSIYLGQFVNDICTAVAGQVNPNAFANGQPVLNGFIQKGHYCIGLLDSQGSIKRPQTYTLRVSHP